MGCKHSRPRRIPDDHSTEHGEKCAKGKTCKSDQSSEAEPAKSLRNPVKDADRYCAFYEPLVDVNSFQKEIKRMEEEAKREKNQQKQIQVKA
ncbi:unnamed protein product [Rodentolepis nana]|uniref:Zgc: n=1 Tax=Rodentolepis nana TaxID=102285 RepID=A0A0R3TFG1_RODNA|nr:unnamed protein product [Rodentolepis nana]